MGEKAVEQSFATTVNRFGTPIRPVMLLDKREPRVYVWEPYVLHPLVIVRSLEQQVLMSTFSNKIFNKYRTLLTLSKKYNIKFLLSPVLLSFFKSVLCISISVPEALILSYGRKWYRDWKDFINKKRGGYVRMFYISINW